MIYRKYPIRKKSDRQNIKDKCFALLREILKIERGNKCEVCGRKANNLGLFHIISQAQAPCLIFHRQNLLIMCWQSCHFYWHHNQRSVQGQRVLRKIIELRGKNWERDLKSLAAIQPKMSAFQMGMYYEALKSELEFVKKNLTPTKGR